MRYLDLTLPTPQENLACDEALLDSCDAGDGPEVLRFWEPQQHFVVVGYSNQIEREVNVTACEKVRIPILRRCSGGGAVLLGPCCLNYALILRTESESALQTVTGTNRFVMERHRAALDMLLSRGSGSNEAVSSNSALRNPQSAIVVEGHTDLAVEGRKFSGNAQRRRRNSILFHGTFLLGIELPVLEEVLRRPSRQPVYRRDRTHGEFLKNLGVAAEAIKRSLSGCWKADLPLEGLCRDRIQRLTEAKYANSRWTWSPG